MPDSVNPMPLDSNQNMERSMSSFELISGGCNINIKKRKRDSKVFKFKSFGEYGYPVELNGSFMENLKGLLQCGQMEEGSSCINGFRTWSFLLEITRQPAPVYKMLWVVEENIDPSSTNPHCNHCVYVGWGDNLICNKKYHFLLPNKDISPNEAPLTRDMPKFNDEDGHPWKNGKIMDLQKLQHGHSLHGVFHSNGYGHLLCINGEELGSELTGSQIMDFWDRLCTGLRARKVSLNDTSRKREMELRLLYGLAYGEPWFGRWGYKFSRGCFGVTPPLYNKAIEALQGIPLLLLTLKSTDSTTCCDNIPMILSRYHSLSNHSLVTLGDLFHFMLQLETRIPEENIFISSSNFGGLSETSCRWSAKRIEMATRVIVEALKRANYRWISRQEVRDAARAYIGDTGLLDFVLKSLGNHVVGNFLVRRSLNPVTKVLEYSLEDISKLYPGHKLNAYGRSNITRGQVMKDVACLYKLIFGQTTECMHNLDVVNNNTIPIMARILLDSKYFVKEYNGDVPSKSSEAGITMRAGNSKLRVFCTISARSDSLGLFHNMPPYECFVLHEHTTVDELKLKVEKAFRELYLGMRSFTAESVLINVVKTKGSESVFGLVEAGGMLVVEGRVEPENEGIIYEGMRSIIVDCTSCGAKVDDGERMVCCDICEVWQHTRCVEIPDDEPVPSIFLCKICEGRIVLSPSLL